MKRLVAALALAASSFACSRDQVEPLGGTWRVVWIRPFMSTSRFPHLFRGDVKVAEFVSRYRMLGEDCVLFVAGGRDLRGLYAACGEREPILLSATMDDPPGGAVGAAGLGTDRVPLPGGLWMSSEEAIRRAKAQPKFVPGRVQTPRRPASLAAAIHGGAEDVDAVLASGADPNALDKDGCTPLFYAAQIANAPVVARLLEKGARADVANAEGDTALHYLRSEERLPSDGPIESDGGIVARLVQHGARIDAQNNRGATPLARAIRRNDVVVVKALIDAGADPLLADRAGDSPASLASAVGESPHHDRISEIVRLQLSGQAYETFLKRRTASRATEHLARLAGGDWPVTELAKFIDEGADVNAAGYRGITPLMTAAQNRKSDKVRLFLSRGADPNRRDAQGGTALMEAAHSGDVESIRLLLANGADINARTTGGRTALSWAEFMKHAECAAVLRAAGGQ